MSDVHSFYKRLVCTYLTRLATSGEIGSTDTIRADKHGAVVILENLDRGPQT